MALQQKYHPYTVWEDWLNGMWTSVDKQKEQQLLQKAYDFTSDYKKYGAAMHEVVMAWPLTMEHNLTNPSINKKAFVGHCAVCFKLGIPEHITRSAWKLLTVEQQNLANWQADDAIALWKKHYELKGKQIGLFENV